MAHIFCRTIPIGSHSHGAAFTACLPQWSSHCVPHHLVVSLRCWGLCPLGPLRYRYWHSRSSPPTSYRPCKLEPVVPLLHARGPVASFATQNLVSDSANFDRMGVRRLLELGWVAMHSAALTQLKRSRSLLPEHKKEPRAKLVRGTRGGTESGRSWHRYCATKF